MQPLPPNESTVYRSAPVRQLPRVWLAIAIASLAAGFTLTFDPVFNDLASTVITLLPFVLLPTLAAAFTRLPAGGPWLARTVAAVASVAAWSILVLNDDRWSILTFALLGLCFSIGRASGVGLAAVVTGIWTLAWALADGPEWRLLVPVASFGAGVILWMTLVRAEGESAELAEIVERLRAAQSDLAASEREKGALEERSKFAGEIHDTLAQGFTSIVLLSRAARRTDDWEQSIDAIEAVAAENLQAARRLVAAIGPAELESASLPDALDHQLATTMSHEAAVEFHVAGSPVPLAGSVEVTFLRGLQEALLNVRTHADAHSVYVTLTYFHDCVVLDVRDDGEGFAPGVVADRADLTGGQGLIALRRRAESLGGYLTVESTPGQGSAISIQLPTGVA